MQAMQVVFGLICGAAVGLLSFGLVGSGTSMSKDAAAILGMLFGVITAYTIIKVFHQNR